MTTYDSCTQDKYKLFSSISEINLIWKNLFVNNTWNKILNIQEWPEGRPATEVIKDLVSLPELVYIQNRIDRENYIYILEKELKGGDSTKIGLYSIVNEESIKKGISKLKEEQESLLEQNEAIQEQGRKAETVDQAFTLWAEGNKLKKEHDYIGKFREKLLDVIKKGNLAKKMAISRREYGSIVIKVQLSDNVSIESDGKCGLIRSKTLSTISIDQHSILKETLNAFVEENKKVVADGWPETAPGTDLFEEQLIMGEKHKTTLSISMMNAFTGDMQNLVEHPEKYNTTNFDIIKFIERIKDILICLYKQMDKYYLDLKLLNIFFCLDENNFEFYLGDVESVVKIGETGRTTYPPPKYIENPEEVKLENEEEGRKFLSWQLGIVILELCPYIFGITDLFAYDFYWKHLFPYTETEVIEKIDVILSKLTEITDNSDTQKTVIYLLKQTLKDNIYIDDVKISKELGQSTILKKPRKKSKRKSRRKSKNRSKSVSRKKTSKRRKSRRKSKNRSKSVSRKKTSKRRKSKAKNKTQKKTKRKSRRKSKNRSKSVSRKKTSKRRKSKAKNKTRKKNK